MTFSFKAFLILTSILLSRVNGKMIANSPPNIVFIIADDLGWNDVSFHGSDQIPTPNIDALAYNGLILNQHYTAALCTPSRAALLTGKYPIHTGMQHDIIREAEPRGLGLNERLLPQFLLDAGYNTHAIGKWHLGFYKKEYTPTYRGFQSHYGYFQGFEDYYTHEVSTYDGSFTGYDMRRNLSIDWSARGKYATDLFTQEAVKIINNHNNSNPLFLYIAHLAAHAGNKDHFTESPKDSVATCTHIKDPKRRNYAASVTKLDESVGEVMEALKSKNMLDNSVIIFISDNGAPTHGPYANHGSNYPFRGIKKSAWEGGNRNVAAVWSPLIKKPQRVANQLMYITDWMPTLYSMAGFDLNDLGVIDGVDMWKALSEDLASPRREILYNIDDIENPYAALRIDDWKYIIGSPLGEDFLGWYGESGANSGIEYKPQNVLSSKTALQISLYIKEDKKPNLKFLQTSKILQLRVQAQVKCKYQDFIECRPTEKACLFNLKHDPCERVNLAQNYSFLLQSFEEKIHNFRKTMVKAKNKPEEYAANPDLWKKTWTFWRDNVPL